MATPRRLNSRLSFISIPIRSSGPTCSSGISMFNMNCRATRVVTVSYVGSKGTHLGRQSDLNQLYPDSGVAESVSVRANHHCGRLRNADKSPAILTSAGMSRQTDNRSTGQAGGQSCRPLAATMPIPYRPFYGISTITRLENQASSNYHALQVSARKSVGALNLSAGLHLQPLHRRLFGSLRWHLRQLLRSRLDPGQFQLR